MKSTDKIKIFLVDDDPIFTKMLEYSLLGTNAEVRVFTNGEDCIKSLNEDPQIVVLDYALNTKLNGVQVLNKIKHSSPDTEVIMLSGKNEKNLIKDTMKYGAYDFIEKGEDAIYAVKKEIGALCDKIEEMKERNSDYNRLFWINAAIIFVIAILFVLTHIK